MYRKDIAKTVQQPRKIFPKGHIITQEGEKGDRAWLVESGNVSITVHDTLVATVGEGAIIGEMALVDGGPRSATVQALTDVSCQELNGSKFHRLLDTCSPLAACLLESLSDTIRRAQGLPQVMGRGSYHYIKSRPRGAEPVELKTFSSGSFIYRDGEVADCAYLIRSGEVTVRKDFAEVVHHGAGRVIGELALFEHTRRAATAMAAEQTVCEIITRHEFEHAIASMPEILRDLVATYIKRVIDIHADTG